MPPQTERTFRDAKPTEKARKIFDGGGLYLHIEPHGSKLWRMAYRFEGIQRVLSFGSYPTISLREAREARADAKRFLAKGIDPSAVKKAEKKARREARKNTFQAVAQERLAKWKAEGDADATLAKKKWLLDFAITAFGNRPISAIKTSDLLRVLEKIEGEKHYETATRVRSIVGAVIRYAIATDRAEHDISANLHRALVTSAVRHHPAITDPRKIGELLRAIDGFEGHTLTKIALKLAPLVFVRPGELRMAEWSEFNLAERVWRIPAQKTKMRRDHIVPLSTQAIALIEQLREITGETRYLFPSIRSWQRPMSENTLNAALRRLGYSGDEMTTHGFRSMASTRLNESGKFKPDIIERQLAHLEHNEVRRAYNAAEHMPERIEMMQYWADYLDTLRQMIVR